MSMISKIFRPGPGNVPARYTAAYVNGTGVYRGDLVHWDHTAPTSQGSSGVLPGQSQTLTAKDFIFVRHAAATTEAGLQAGCVCGRGIEDNVTNATALSNDTVIVVQTWGVAPNAWVDAATTAAGGKLTCAATSGEFTYLAAYAVTATNVADGALAGVALTDDATTWTRGTATAEEVATIFVRCDF